MATTRRSGAGFGTSHNLFFALWPDDALRERIASTAARIRDVRSPSGRWIAPNRYHLTVVFLGQYAAVPAPIVAAALRAGDAAAASAFDFALDVAGSFPNRSIPWWLGCSSHVAGLLALRTRLLDGLRAADLRVRDGGAHVPHVTILRDADRPLAATPIEPIEWRVGHFVLVDSLLGAASRHAIARRWPLT